MVNLIRRDPLASIFSFPRWMEDLDDLGSQRGLKVRETDKDIVVDAVVAGVPSENVEIDIEDGVLTIKAEEKKEEKKQDVYKSSSYQYYYTLALSGGQWDKTTADVKNGVVVITIPKAESARPHRVKVSPKSK